MLFATLRVLVDEPRAGRRFLVLGSASPELMRQTSESLAGRIAYHELGGFSLEETGSGRWERLWRRGGFPRSFLARSDGESHRWHENVGKRQVKAPRVFVRDSGVLHTLLGLRSAREIDPHPKVGASREGFALDAVVTHLLVVRGGNRLGFEFKRSTTPAATRSMHVAMGDLRLRELWVVHAGERAFDLGPHMRATPRSHLLEELSPLR